MQLLKRYYLLLVIIILAGILRFGNLGGNPPGLTWDEAALGYNAYSLLQTGKDEYGQFMPLNLKSFGDWKPAVYAYLVVPLIAVLGLNEWAVRLPSAIFGVASVLLLFFLGLELFKNKWLALLSAFFLAISPWHLQFSRSGFEANIALFFNILGIYFFIRKKYIFSALIFSLSIFTYQASRFFVPLILVCLIFLYGKQIFWKTSSKLSVLIFSLVFGVMVYMTFFSGQSSRLETQNFFAYKRSSEEIQLISNEDNLEINALPFKVLHGEWWTYIKGLGERFMIYFSPKMLFVDGDYNQRHKVPDLGVLYYFSVFLIPLGIFYLWKTHVSSKFIFLWLVLAPLPAVFSRDLISTLRALNMVIPWVILEAAGFYFLISLFKKLSKIIFITVLISVFLLFTFNFLIFLDRYFIHAPTEYSEYWLYGYREIYQKWSNKFSKYDKVVMTDQYGQPYIYYLFYTKYSPAKFQKQAKLDQPSVDVGTVRRIDNIEFRHIYWPADRGLKNTLFIGPEEQLPDKDILPFKEFKKLDEIYFLNGEMAFKVVETNK